MEIYRIWYRIAFVLEIIAIIVNLTNLNSIKAKNLEKVWLIYSMSQWKFIEWKKTSFLSKILWIIFSLVINPLLSWITVMLKIYSYVNLWIKKSDVPEKIREIQYKLWASLLTKDEVKGLLQESANFLWKPIDFNDEDELEEDNTLILQDDKNDYWWYRDVTIEGNKLYRNSYPKDFGSDFTRICEFKVEWTKVYQRLLEEKSDFTWEEYCFVKDWVVLESEIMERENKLHACAKSFNEEKLQTLKKECEWNEIGFYKVKYFILKRHPKLVSKEELIKSLRSELERIKLGFLMVKKLCEQNKFTIKYSEEYHSYQYEYDEYDETDEKSREYIDKFNKQLATVCEKSKCERGEIDQSKEIIETLEWYLNNEKK